MPTRWNGRHQRPQTGKLQKLHPVCHANIVDDFEAAVEPLLPDEISFESTGSYGPTIDFERSGGLRITRAGEAPNVFRYRIFVVPRSSGGGFYLDSSLRLASK